MSSVTFIDTPETNFEKELEDNLALYTKHINTTSKDLFQCHREISLARYALSKQAESYAMAIDILMSILEKHRNTKFDAKEDGSVKILTNILQMIEHIENKSKALISSASQVTQLIGAVVDIDVDKATLSHMLINLPNLVEETVSDISGNKDMAQMVSIRLGEVISGLMSQIRFTESKLEHKSNSSDTNVESISLIQDQVTLMINSVPGSQNSQPLYKDTV